jgi:hypothetical protein
MSAHNALASRILINQITPYLPKDNEKINMHNKCLHAMLNTATMVDPVHDQEDGDRGHKLDHQQCPREDSANNNTPLEEHGRGHGSDNHDLRNVICGRDACGQIKKQHQEREHIEQEQCDERDYDYYGPSMTNLTSSAP